MRKRSLAVAAALLTLLAALSLAQTTGSMEGRAADESGGILPGVTVEARGPALQGARVATTDSSGRYRLSVLPPGLYDVTFTLPGFASESKKGVSVGLGKETTLDAVLHPAASAAIVVSAEAPVVDTTSTTLGENFSQRAIQTLPTGRNYSSIAQATPGTSSDADSRNTAQETITVYGSSGAENAFYIDGVNTTGVEYGFQGKSLNYEFVQEVNVQTGGYEAEYGRSTGGIINVITKSGGNEFHGDAFGYFNSDSLQAAAEPVVSTSGTVEGFTREDFGADLGGYFWKDRIWFFGAYDRINNTTKNAILDTVNDRIVQSESKSTVDLASAKLTFSMTPSHNLVGSFIQDPRSDTGAINDPNHTLNGDPLTYDGQQQFGGSDWSARYQGIFGSNWVASAQWALHQESNNVGPATAAGDIIQEQDAANNFYQTGGFGLIQDKTFQRDFYGGALTRYLQAHEVKFGVEYEQAKAEVIKRYSGGQLVTKYENVVHPAQPIYDHFYWTTPTATVDDAPVSQLNASPEHKNLTFFLQDRWAILPNLTLNLGIRWDQQKIIDANGTQQVNLNDDFAPRVGVIWDPSKNHRSKVFGSYGRYYEEIPMDLVIRSFSYERQTRIINYSLTSTEPNTAAEDDFLDPDGNPTRSAILGGFTEPSDPNMKGQYITEYIIGGEQEIGQNWAVGLKGVYRNYGEVIEDFLCINDGTYCIGNPGKGSPGQSASGFYPGFTQVYGLDYETLYPAPRPVRIYRGIQLDVTKRFADNWQMIASYIYSTLEGNYDGEYAPFTQTTLADPNISAAYDYFDFFTDGSDLDVITNRGPLSNDRRNQFKVSGLYLTPFKLSVGLTAYYRTGTPWTRYGYSDAYGRYEFFLTNRGGEGRMPSTYEADLHLGYPIAIGPVDVNLLVDVFSLFNAQRAIILDQRWGFQEADNASPTPVNPDYGLAALRTPPTIARFGVRVSF